MFAPFLGPRFAAAGGRRRPGIPPGSRSRRSGWLAGAGRGRRQPRGAREGWRGHRSRAGGRQGGRQRQAISPRACSTWNRLCCAATYNVIFWHGQLTSVHAELTSACVIMAPCQPLRAWRRSLPTYGQAAPASCGCGKSVTYPFIHYREQDHDHQDHD